MALQRCKICSFIVALIFMLVPFRLLLRCRFSHGCSSPWHHRWWSHRGIWATTSTSSRWEESCSTEWGICFGTTKEIHWNSCRVLQVCCMLTSLFLSLLQEVTIPVFFEDGHFVVQTEGVTKVWCECGDVYKLGIFKTYCWEWMMLVEIQSFFGLGDLFFRHANVSIDYAPAI